MADTVGVQALFPTDAALQDAIGRLTLLGFDRADLSVPDRANDDPAAEAPAAMPNTETDTRQARTLASSMAGAVGAVAAAGATIATGGAAALVVGAALAAGAGAAGLANVGGTAVGTAASDTRDEAGARGELHLMVRTRTQEKMAAAETAMRDAGGTSIAQVVDDPAAVTQPTGQTAGISSAAWTG